MSRHAIVRISADVISTAWCTYPVVFGETLLDKNHEPLMIMFIIPNPEQYKKVCVTSGGSFLQQSLTSRHCHIYKHGLARETQRRHSGEPKHPEQ
jgi:hypothetical protein